MSDDPDPQRLEALKKRIAAARQTPAPRPRPDADLSAASQGWRMVIELVSGLGIGFGIGYGLDLLFGTLPVLLVLFTLLGFAAGVKTMLRTAAEVQAAGRADKSAGDEGE